MTEPAPCPSLGARALSLLAVLVFYAGCFSMPQASIDGMSAAADLGALDDSTERADMSQAADASVVPDLAPSPDMTVVPPWPKSFGGGRFLLNHSRGVAVDGAGNVIFVGMFHGPIDFGGGPVDSGVEGYNGILVKYDAAGRYLWGRHIHPGEVWIDSVVVDPRGNIAIIGYGNNVDVGGPVLLSDDFVVAYDGDGEYLWSRTSSDLPGSAFVSSIAYDSHGNLAAARFNLSGGVYGLWLTLFDPTGSPLWTQLLTVGDDMSFPGEPSGPSPTAKVAVDNQDNILLAGTFSGLQDLGSGLVDSAPAARSPFVNKYDSSSKRIFTTTRAGLDIDVSQLATDSSGDVLVLLGQTQLWRLRKDGTEIGIHDHAAEGYEYVEGLVTSGTDYYLGGTQLLSGSYALLVSRHLSTDAVRWTGAYGPASLYGLGLDPTGHLYLAGDYQGSLVFDGITIRSPVNSLSMFLARVSP